jgi:hypothetical protein
MYGGAGHQWKLDFHVTVEHPDTGWEDYAHGWDLVAPDGTVLKLDPNTPYTRLLLNPNVDKQPFTHGQAGIVMPPGVEQVSARAHDLVDSYGGGEVRLDLTAESGPGFEIERSVPPAKAWERLPLPEQWAGAAYTEC